MTGLPTGAAPLPALRLLGRCPKDSSSRAANAGHHGVLSTNPVTPEIERQAAWEDHLSGQIAALNPSAVLNSGSTECGEFHDHRIYQTQIQKMPEKIGKRGILGPGPGSNPRPRSSAQGLTLEMPSL